MYYYNNWEAQWDSDYDSTWDDEEPQPPEKKKQKTQYQSNYGNRAARDMQNYRHGYGEPTLDTANCSVHQEHTPNLWFYQNEIPFEPYGVKIEEFHQDWKEDYRELEYNHGFIQWLFPLRERGVNPEATPLTRAEIQMMKADGDVMRRFLESYKLMLGFYGIKLKDEESGEVIRAENWMERFRNLNNNGHNNLRITRILKCLGEMGYDRFQAPLVKFFLVETLVNNQLPRVTSSVLDYFMFTVKDKQQRRDLVLFAWKNYKSQEAFIWGPKEKLRYLSLHKEKGNEETAEGPDGTTVSPIEDVPHSTGGPHHKGLQGTGTGEGADGTAGGGDVAPTEDVPHSTEGPHHKDLQGTAEGPDGTTGGGDVAPTQDVSHSIEGPHHKDLQEPGTGEGPDGTAGGGDVAPIEDVPYSTGGPHHKGLQGTGEGPEERGHDGGPGVDRLGGHDDEVCPPEDVIPGSNNEKPITEDKGTENVELITEGNSSGNEGLITEGNSLGKEGLTTEGNSLGKEGLTTEGNSLEEWPTTEGNSLGKKGLTTEGTSFGTEHIVDSQEEKALLTQVKEPGRYHDESPKAEARELLESRVAWSDWCGSSLHWFFSLCGYCCHICRWTPRQ